MGNLIVTPPREIGRDPINTLTRWRQEAASLPNVETVNKRIAMVSLAKLWAGKFGAEKDVVVRAAAAARLTLERRLGELLAQTVSRPHPKGHGNIQLIRDELLPDGVTWNASSAVFILGVVLSWLSNSFSNLTALLLKRAKTSAVASGPTRIADGTKTWERKGISCLSSLTANTSTPGMRVMG